MKKTKKPSDKATIKTLRQELATWSSKAISLEQECIHARNEYRDRGKTIETLTNQLGDARSRLGKLRADVLEYTLATNEPVTASTQRLAGLQRAIADGCRDEPVYRAHGASDFASIAGISGNYFTQ